MILLPETVTIKSADLDQAAPLTIKLRYSGPLRLRFWLAAKSIRFAAWLCGGSADVAREGP